MAGSVGNNSVNASDTPDGFSLSGGQTKFEDMPKEMLKLFKEVEAYVNRIAKNWKQTIEETKKASGDINKDQPGAGRLGLGSFTRAEKIAGLGMGAMAVGSAYMSMAPNTMAAVTQRIGADTYAGVSGMSSRQAIMQANRQVGGGATSAMGPTMAAMSLYSSGYTANSLSSKNIMSRLGGLSAMTGMSNEAAAASVANVNGMAFLRMGVRARDSKGNLLPPEQLVNQVFNALTRGGKLTKEQAAAGFLNPGGKGYNTLKAITGGDEALMQTLQSGMMLRASKGSAITKADMSNPNKTLDILGVDKSSPLRANFRYNTSEAKKLEATEQGLVGGYNASLRTAASLNDAYSKMAELLGPVNQGLMTLKGILQTFPNAGGMGGTISNIASGAAGVGGAAMQYKMMSSFLNGGGAAGEAGAAGRAGSMAMTMGKFGGYAGVGAVSFGGGYLVGKGGKALGKKLGVSKGVTRGGSALAGAGTGALIGAGIGSVVPIVGTAAGAVIGSILGGIGGFFGSGGEVGNTMDLGHASSSSSNAATKHFLPVPKGTPVSSPYGPRPKAAAIAQGQGRHISSYHKGIDYKVASGTAVSSSGDGVVVEIGNQAAGWGNYVLIQHADGTKTRYAHLRQIGVSRNQKVKAGQVIGRSGGGPNDPGRGNAGGAHLHFEALSKSGVRVNPANYLNGITTAFVGASSYPTNMSSGGTKALSFDTKNGNLSSSDLATLLGSGEAVSWEDVTARYSGTKLQNLLNETPDPYTGKPTSNKKELIKTIASKGFHGKALKTAYAISIAESGGRPNAKGDVSLQDGKWGPSIGLFQIRSLKDWKKYNDPYRDATRLYDPRYNAEAAFKKSNGGKSFKAWSTYTSGAFVKHLGEADAMAKAAAVGGPVGNPIDLPHGGSSTHVGRSGSASFSADSHVVVNLSMPITIASASPGEAQKLVKLVAAKLKDEFKNDQKLKHLGSSL